MSTNIARVADAFTGADYTRYTEEDLMSEGRPELSPTSSQPLQQLNRKRPPLQPLLGLRRQQRDCHGRQGRRSPAARLHCYQEPRVDTDSPFVRPLVFLRSCVLHTLALRNA